MSRARLIPLLAASLAALASGHALAATKPKPACLQVQDDTGDARVGGSLVPGTPSSDALDIVSGDIATGKKNLVAAIRLKSLADETLTAGGALYTFTWSSGGVQRSLSYREYADGSPDDAVFDPDTASGVQTDLITVPATRDVASATITFTLPRKLEPGLKKAGAVIGDLQIRANFAFNRQGGYSSSGADLAETARKYTDLAPTCLKGT
jgi:hypothetical protein